MLRILVVDDSPVNRATAELLRGDDRNLTIVSCLQSAMDQFELMGNTFDVVLTDNELPEWDAIPTQFIEWAHGDEKRLAELRAKTTPSPIGVQFALWVCRSVKYVGVITTTYHHANASAMFIGRWGGSPLVFENGARLLCVEAFSETYLVGPKEARGKDWCKLLETLIA